VRAPRTINGFYYGESCDAKPKNAGKTLRSVHLAARQADGLSLEKCDLNKTFISGGFGGASSHRASVFCGECRVRDGRIDTPISMRNISQRLVDVRFTPKSRHWNSVK
jgi:hypothetical protein